jgi:hypothetical protein
MKLLGTYTGRMIDLRNFSKSDIDLTDITISLSRQNRYLGHILVDFSVLKHSIFCSMIAGVMGDSDRIKKLMILHDVEETWFQDEASPIASQFPNKERKHAKEQADVVIHDFFGFPGTFDNDLERKRVKTIDMAACIIELMCFRPTYDWTSDKENHAAPVVKLVDTLIDMNFKVPADLVDMSWQESCESFYELLAVIHFEGTTGSEVVVDDVVVDEDVVEGV